jgi:hypothetical protein
VESSYYQKIKKREDIKMSETKKLTEEELGGVAGGMGDAVVAGSLVGGDVTMVDNSVVDIGDKLVVNDLSTNILDNSKNTFTDNSENVLIDESVNVRL